MAREVPPRDREGEGSAAERQRGRGKCRRETERERESDPGAVRRYPNSINNVWKFHNDSDVNSRSVINEQVISFLGRRQKLLWNVTLVKKKMGNGRNV